MKNIIVLCFAMLFGIQSCTYAQTTKSKKSDKTPNITVYYFHFTRRCNTCMSVEANAKLALETLYADKVKKGEYTFKAINLDDASSKAIAEKLGVSGQTLLVVYGDKKIDITSQGFMYANEPEKIKEEVKKAVEKILKD